MSKVADSKSSDPVTRERLYELVWSEPLTKAAMQFGVPASQLAEACDRLKVPRPAPGYWGKLAVGRAPARPPLLGISPQDPAQWTPGARLAAVKPPRVRKALTREATSTISSRSAKTHPLLIGARALFEGSKTAYDSQYLRPRKRLLVDLVVTESGLDKVLAVASRLFTAFEAKGHRVSIATEENKFQRAEIDEREVRTKKDRNGRYHLWRPHRITVAHVGTMPIGLTFIELSENVEVRYVDGKYVRETEATARRAKLPGDWSWTTRKDLPTGRVSVLAYSPYHVAKWSREWQEERANPLLDSAEIVEALEDSIPEITRLIEEGERAAEVERKRWKAQWEKWEREEEAKKRAEAIERSRKDLLSIIEDWAASKRLDAFFADALERLKNLAEDEREAVEARLMQARELIGSTDALVRFQAWKAADECPNCAEDVNSEIANADNE